VRNAANQLHQGNLVNSGDFALAGRRVWVAGHTGMAGSALVRRLDREDCQVLTVSHGDLDLREQADVERWLYKARPEAVFVAAGTVGGIHANNSRPAEFVYDNLAIAQNIIHGSLAAGVGKLLFLGSSCIYPRLAQQPIAEESLLTGPLEPTNEWYAIAKIAGIKLCQAYRRQYGCDFISIIPTNLYGPNDNYDLLQGHVAAALICKINHAKIYDRPTIELWGSGTPIREFLYVEDFADAAVFVMKRYSEDLPLNVGTGEGTSIRDLATLIARIAGYQGKFVFNPNKPDGAPHKVVKVDRLSALGWRASTSLEDGLRKAFQWYHDHFRDDVSGYTQLAQKQSPF
jgi:GDP-L-fucose synthase